MQYCIIFFLLLLHFNAEAQQKDSRNIFIITTDGYRWQEVFNGADEKLVRDTNFVKDTTLILQQYWADSLAQRKEKLMPFFWNVIAKQGQLSGNRAFKNKVNVANFYKISYPGYNEIFTGYPDKLFIPNWRWRNRNSNVLQYLNSQPNYKGAVAAFCSWNVMPFILNEANSYLPVNAGYEDLSEDEDTLNALINQVQNAVPSKGKSRHDLLTFESAKNYIQQKHPKVLFLGLGETDEYAHRGAYDLYLQKAHQVDAMIAELWYYVQTDPFYKNNTTFIITTDHGRGREGKWTTHGFWVGGSGETWMAMIGKGIAPAGEEKQKQQIYLDQVAATIALLTGEEFSPKHPVAQPLNVLKAAPAVIGKNVSGIAVADK